VVTKLLLNICAILLQWFVVSLFKPERTLSILQWSCHSLCVYFLTFIFFLTFWHSNIYIILQKVGKILKISKYSQWLALKRLQKQVGIFFQQTNCHRSGNGQGKNSSRSRKCLSQGKLTFWKQDWVNATEFWVERMAVRGGWKLILYLILCSTGQGNVLFIRGKSGNFEKW